MPEPAQQIRFCTSRDGTRIAYATCGAGPPLVWAAVWAHHLKLDWDCPVWRPWLDMLARRHTLVRYDWRGCGLSDREHVEFSFERFIEDLEAVIEAAGLDAVCLVRNGGRRGDRHGLCRTPPGAGEPSRPLRELRSQQAGGQPHASGRGGGGSPDKDAGSRLARRRPGVQPVLHVFADAGRVVRAVAIVRRFASPDHFSSHRPWPFSGPFSGSTCGRSSRTSAVQRSCSTPAGIR